MTPFPSARRPLLAAVGFFALAAVALAQEPKKDGVKDAAKAKVWLSLTPDGKARVTPSVRPNNQLKLFVVIDHDDAVPDRTYRVQLIGPKETALAAPKTVVVTSGKPVALAFEPPAPKKEAPKKEEPAPKKDADPAPKAEPPPGFLLPPTLETGVAAFKFIVRVTSDPPRADQLPNDTPFVVNVLTPAAYIKQPEVSLTAGLGKGIGALVTATDAKIEGEDKDKKDAPKFVEFIPKVQVKLVFPPQVGVRTTELRAGTYSRDIFRTGQKVELSASNLPLTRLTDAVKFHFDIDGYARAFTYTLNVNRALGKTSAANEIAADRADTPAVRLYPVNASRRAQDIGAQVTSGTLALPKYPTLPVKDLRFKVEVDRAPPKSTLSIKVDRTGNRSFAAPDETIALDDLRDIKVYLEPGGEGGVWTLSNTVTDHVVGVDVSALRGAHALQAVLRFPDPASDVEGTFKEVTAEYTLLVDDTPPPGEDVDFDYSKFPKRHVKGVPLEVRVWADDPESAVEKVTFYLGKPGEDGKIPEDAPKFEGVRLPSLGRATNSWVGQIQLPAPAPAPADPKAPPAPPKAVDVTAVAENGVGLKTPQVVRIELVDPKGGTIAATIKRGGRPQAGVEVSLRDNEGKEKGVLKTNAAGVARFVNLPPGPYRLYAGKPDASTGLIGNTVATIPDPPATKAIEVDLDLAKRR